jgi:tetrahydromethanopterin S-methyltransferase subunit C
LVDPLYGFVSFVIGVIISSIIIYLVTKLFGEKEGIKTAIITAVIGAIVYSITYFLLGNGFWAAIAGGFVWLLTLKALYNMGWLKSFVIAFIVWVAAAITGILLPTAPGPL